MAITIEGLQIEITENTEKAVKGLDALTKSLEKLKKVTGDLGKSLEGVNFDTFSKQMKQLSTSLRPLQGFKTQASGLLDSLSRFKRTAEEINEFTDFDKFASQIKILANSLTPLSGINTKLGATLKALYELPVISDTLDSVDFESFANNIKQVTNSLTPLTTIQTGLGSTLNQLARFEQLVQQLDAAFQNTKFADNILKLVEALRPLTTLGKSTLGSMLNQLRKLPEIMEQLSNIDIDALGAQIERVTNAVRPLANEMNKVAAGFSAFPSRIQRLITQNERLSSSNKSLSRSYGILGTGIRKAYIQMGALLYGARRIARAMADWVVESNSYIENLNLFRVSLREGADEALDYAYKVQEAFGIDPSEWIRFQAVFQNMLTGFGVVGEKARIMSRNLTQLGYDLATIFNVDYATAMEKLESAIAGQPRPMREWGFDMSEATLKLVAMRHGIEQNVETMTQFEKSQLRYLQLMETARQQGILGNFAREIHTPANALRILNQQLLQFRRALGNMVLPIIMKVLPYLQAFVVILTDAARALANFFGFTLPVIDYSGLSEIGDIIGDIEDNAEEATKAAKKLKNALMGFDEINLLNLQTPAGAGIGGAGAGGGLIIDPSLYDYDFLGQVENEVNEIVDRIYSKIRPYINWIKDNFDHILDVTIAIGLALLTWKVSTTVMSFFDTVQGLLRRFSSGESFPALGISLMVSGIYLGTKGLANLVAGEGDVIDAIKAAIGAALGLSGSLIAFGTGPLGWTIGIAAVLTITIAGLTIGRGERLDKLIQDALTGDGTLISDLSNAFSNLMDEIGRGLDPLIEGGRKLKEYKENIDRSKQSIETLFNVINSNASNSATELEKLIASMSKLLDETQLLRDQAYDNIVHALSNSFINVQQTVGKAADEIIKDILLIKNEGDKKLTDAQMRIREYEKAWREGRISVEEATKGIMEEYDRLYGGRTILDEVGNSFYGLISRLNRINWKEPGERAKELEKIAESARRTKEKVDEHFDAMTESIEIMLKDIDDPQTRQKMAEALYLFRDEQREAAYRKITDNLQLLFTAVQMDLTKAINDVSENASQDWDEMGFWGKLGTSKPEYVAQAIMQFRKDTIDPVSEGFSKILEEFDIENSQEMQTAVENILQKGFKIDPIYGYVYDFTGELSNVTSEEISRMEKQFALLAEDLGISIPENIGKGVDSKLIDLKKTLESQNNTVTKMISSNPSFLKLLSTAYIAGLNIEDEIAKGLKDNLIVVKDEATGTVKEIENTITGEVVAVTPTLVENLKQLGLDITTGLQTGVDEGVKEKEYKNIFQRISTWFKEFFGIQSPSTVFMALGRDLAEGLLLGVDNYNVRSSWNNIWKSFTGVVNGELEGAKRGINRNLDNIASDIRRSSISGAWRNLWSNLPTPRIKLPHFSITGSFSLYPLRVPKITVNWYARGGFPDEGELFIAREAGPELVGKIGGRTAVVNNDQIVTAVSDGVYRAVSKALSESGGSGDIILRVNENDLGRITKQAINRYNRQTGQVEVLI